MAANFEGDKRSAVPPQAPRRASKRGMLHAPDRAAGVDPETLSLQSKSGAGKPQQLPSASIDDPIDRLGREVRSLRKAKGWSLQQLAERCGKSVGFLSQVERGMSKPTVSALSELAAALDVQISWFFPNEKTGESGDHGVVVRKAARRRLSFESGISDFLLSPNLDGPLELLWSVMDPGSMSGDSSYRHRGDEAGVVIRGVLELWVDDRHFELLEGDSFSFSSNQPHRYRNPGTSVTEIAWVVTPPSY